MFSLLVIQILLQMMCFGLSSYHTYKDKQLLWGFFSGAFLLMSMRRITALISYKETSSLISTIDTLILPFTITLLLSIGLVYLHVKDYKSKKLLYEIDSIISSKLKRNNSDEKS